MKEYIGIIVAGIVIILTTAMVTAMVTINTYREIEMAKLGLEQCYHIDEQGKFITLWKKECN